MTIGNMPFSVCSCITSNGEHALPIGILLTVIVLTFASPLLYGGEPSLCVFHHPKGVYQMRRGRVLVKKVALKDNLKTVIHL